MFKNWICSNWGGYLVRKEFLLSEFKNDGFDIKIIVLSFFDLFIKILIDLIDVVETFFLMIALVPILIIESIFYIFRRFKKNEK